MSEIRYGSSSRSQQEISVGQSIGTITKGPLSIMDIVAWCAGTMGAPDSSLGYSSGGLSSQAATGPQLTSWIVHLITNWMGDTGFLEKLSASFNGVPFLGSTTTVSGTVTQISDDDTNCICELAITAHLQNNEVIATGTAVIRFPNNI